MQKDPLSIKDILVSYKKLVSLLVFLAVAANVLGLFFPRLVAKGIDQYVAGTFDLARISWEFLGLSVLVLLFTLAQDVVKTYVSEISGSELRKRLMGKISLQSYMYTQDKTPAYLLTNLTSDVEAIKVFLGSSVPALIAAIFTLIGASILILVTDWRLGLGVLTIIPAIGITFFITFSKMGKLFGVTQETVDKLNGVINSTIIGAALIRVLNSGRVEYSKFTEVNAKARDNGMKIVMLFSSLIPVVMFASSAASLIILYLGGSYVINGTMSIGQFAAFSGYISILLFPIFIIGFTSSTIGRANASMARIKTVFEAEVEQKRPDLVTKEIEGDLEVKDVSLKIGDKEILSDISFKIPKRSKTAIIGPTAAGKTQLLSVLSGLVRPTAGTVKYDGVEIENYDADSFYSNVGLVFQDSVMFNLSLKDNIAFGSGVTEEYLNKAIKAAELSDFIDSLGNGANTMVSERGLSLSGGQKQRIMLARALATNPSVLLLDDFTARVDALTEKNILNNIAREFPNLTLISVTQKISSIEAYDQIIVLVEGEVINSGTHEELLRSTPEYVQIYESQKSTTTYELQS